MNVQLKIKLKSLAAEGRIIRSEEARILHRHAKWKARAESRKGTVPPDTYFSLHAHRRDVVTKEARASHLAYGFLRGVAYKVMEHKCHRRPDWKRVEDIAKRFAVGDQRDTMQRFSEWKDAA